MWTLCSSSLQLSMDQSDNPLDWSNCLLQTQMICLSLSSDHSFFLCSWPHLLWFLYWNWVSHFGGFNGYYLVDDVMGILKCFSGSRNTTYCIYNAFGFSFLIWIDMPELVPFTELYPFLREISNSWIFDLISATVLSASCFANKLLYLVNDVCTENLLHYRCPL